MTRPRHQRTHRRPRPQKAASVDIWRTPGELPDVEPIVVPGDVGALLRSLGDPPMNGRGSTAGHYFNAVAERAAAVAAALAFSADLLAEPDEE